MSAARMIGWLLRAFPAVMLVLTAVLLAALGALLPIVSASTNGPGSGQIMPGFVAIGAALILVAASLVWVAWGVWRAKPWRTHIALLFSALVIIYLVLVAPGAFTSHTSVLDPSTGNLEPLYDTGAEMIVLAIIPYAVALGCLVTIELRQRRSEPQH
jgi:hypothetical protein